MPIPCQNPYLPPGCTDQDVEDAYGGENEECEDCPQFNACNADSSMRDDCELSRVEAAESDRYDAEEAKGSMEARLDREGDIDW